MLLTRRLLPISPLGTYRLNNGTLTLGHIFKVVKQNVAFNTRLLCRFWFVMPHSLIKALFNDEYKYCVAAG